MNKRRIGLITVALIALALSLRPRPAEAVCAGATYGVVPFNFESLTVSTTALGFTAATFDPGGAGGAVSPAVLAIVTVETNPIRFRVDGPSPTASIGHLATAGQSIEVCGTAAVKAMRMIRQGGADATVMVSYYR